MSDSHPLIAYAMTLVAMCYLVTVACALAYFGKYNEAIGVGALTTGLIGVLKLPSARTTTIDNASSDPVPVKAGANV